MKLNASEKNALNSVEYLVWAHNLKVSSASVRDDLSSHPDFPSIAAISDTFTEWRVPNLATRIPKSRLNEIPLPSLVYLNVGGGILAPIKSVTNDTVEWLDTKNGWQKDLLNDFDRKWDGITILVEPNEYSGEPGYDIRRKKDIVTNLRTPLLSFGVILLLGLILILGWETFKNLDLAEQLLLPVKFAGVAVSVLLLWQSLDSDNSYLSSLCNLGENNSCNDVLSSRASKITWWLSWAEVGFFYFSGGLLTLLFGICLNDITFVLLILNVLNFFSLPYVFFSLWYQRYVVHKWCVFCLAVQVLLIAEAVLRSYSRTPLNFHWSPTSALVILIAFTIPVLLWLFLKRILLNSSQTKDLQRQIQKIKFSEAYLKSIFVNSQKMIPFFKDMHTVHLGNPKANNTITIVTNPLCEPCSRMHKELTQLLKNEERVKCQFVFLGAGVTSPVASRILNSSGKETAELMENWYADISQNVDTWISKNVAQHELIDMTEQLRIHQRWCELSGIFGTPVIHVNGTLLPTLYKITDLKRLIPIIGVGSDISSETK